MAELYKTAASLRIIGDDLDPEEITNQLGKQPDASEKRGETIRLPSGRERIARRGRWSVKVESLSPGDLDAQVKDLLSGTTNDIDIWRTITSRFRADIFCGLFLNEGNEGLIVSPNTLKLLGDRGICLGLDIYAGPKDGDDDCSSSLKIQAKPLS